MKKLSLHKGFSNEEVAAMAKQTLTSGGFKEVQIGDTMSDGTIYAGDSPETGKPMYTTPTDAPLTIKFEDALGYAQDLDAHDHRDWRMPTRNELNVLFDNRAAIGGFNVSGSTPANWYWSATPHDEWAAWCQRFSDGAQFGYVKPTALSVRCVR